MKEFPTNYSRRTFTMNKILDEVQECNDEETKKKRKYRYYLLKTCLYYTDVQLILFLKCSDIEDEDEGEEEQNKKTIASETIVV